LAASFQEGKEENTETTGIASSKEKAWTVDKASTHLPKREVF